MSSQSSVKPRYTPGGYRNKLRTTQNRVLLVEGSTDKRTFQQLFHGARQNGYKEPATRLIIDTAELLNSPSGTVLGNREKVEAVCRGMRSPALYPRFVGFADREFRRFDDVALVDEIAGHEVQGRLVWTRGHSTENYFFEPAAFVHAIRAVATTDSLDEAIRLFEMYFQGFVQLACAMSLASRDAQALSLVAGTVDRSVISISSTSVMVDTVAWAGNLMRKTKNNSTMSQSVVRAFSAWEQRLQNADWHLLRWMCHGHVGFATLWSAYSRCILEVSGYALEAERTLRAGRDVRHDVTADAWARSAMMGQADYPVEVMEMLGFSKA